jgi:hypothetical protein
VKALESDSEDGMADQSGARLSVLVVQIVTGASCLGPDHVVVYNQSRANA